METIVQTPETNTNTLKDFINYLVNQLNKFHHFLNEQLEKVLLSIFALQKFNLLDEDHFLYFLHYKFNFFEVF